MKRILGVLLTILVLTVSTVQFNKVEAASTYKLWVSNKNFYKSPTSRLSEGNIKKNYYNVKEAWFYINTEIGWKWVKYTGSQKNDFNLQGDELYNKKSNTLRHKVLDTKKKAGVLSAKKWSQVARVWYLVDTKTKKGSQWITYSLSPNVNEYKPVGGDQIFGPKPYRINYSPEGDKVTTKKLGQLKFADTFYKPTLEFHYDRNNGLKIENLYESDVVEDGYKFSRFGNSISKDLAVSPGDYIVAKQGIGQFSVSYTASDTLIVKVINMTDNYADVEIRVYRVIN